MHVLHDDVIRNGLRRRDRIRVEADQRRRKPNWVNGSEKGKEVYEGFPGSDATLARIGFLE